MNLQYLETTTPGYSIQDLSSTNILTVPFGKVVPARITFLHPGESSEIDFDWLCRTFPLNAPLMDNIEIAFDAIWCPARVLGIAGGESVGFNFEKFFNPRNFQEDLALPNVTLKTLAEAYMAKFGRLDGTLYDYLGYPTFPETFRKLTECISGAYMLVDDLGEGELTTVKFGEFCADILYLSNSRYFIFGYGNVNLVDSIFQLADSPFLPMPDTSFSLSFPLSDNDIVAQWFEYCCFTSWVVRQYASYLGVDVNQATRSRLQNVISSLAVATRTDFSVDEPFSLICRTLKTTPSQLYDLWRAWLFSDAPTNEYAGAEASRPTWNFLNLFKRNLSTGATTGLKAFIGLQIEQPVSLMRFAMYRRIINDWYVNPLLVDGEEAYMDEFAELMEFESTDTPFSYMDMQKRLYGFNDAFVTATPAIDQPDVLLPDNPSIKDIRNLNRLQLMLERIAKTGKRYADQILTTFGIQPDNKTIDRSEVLFRRTTYLDMQSVTQLNQADFGRMLNTPIGSQFGQSTSFQSFQGNTFTADEHGYFVILVSLRPKASYMQFRDKALTLIRPDQFLIPDFAQIGDDRVEQTDIYLDYKANDNAQGVPFGYNQKYWMWMFKPSEIHGLMLNELDYYHMARRFDQTPVLNEDFTSVDVDQNDLNRIFTTYDSSPFLMWINFRHQVLRPLPTSSKYSL